MKGFVLTIVTAILAATLVLCRVVSDAAAVGKMPPISALMNMAVN